MVWRAHQCRVCSYIFLSVQRIVSPEEAAIWEGALETRLMPGLPSMPSHTASPLPLPSVVRVS